MNSAPSLSIAPIQLKIEITRACNLRCAFCYLGKEQNWLADRHMPMDEAMRWIDWCVDNGVPAVRFTGGEATLHPDIEVLFNYAYVRKRYVILNTNGMAAPELYDRLLFSDIRVSVPTLDARRMMEMTGRADALETKVALLNRMAGRRHVRTMMLTAITPGLIGKLEQFALFLQERPWVRWGPLRLESSPDDPRPLSQAQLQAIAEEMDGLMRRYPAQVPGLALAVPFCAVKPTSLGARVFMGKRVCCGPYVALNVDFDGRMTTCFDRNLINASESLDAVRRSPEIRPFLTHELLPRTCRECEHLDRCLGGCTKPEGLVEHDGGLVDYLAGFVGEEFP